MNPEPSTGDPGRSIISIFVVYLGPLRLFFLVIANIPSGHHTGSLVEFYPQSTINPGLKCTQICLYQPLHSPKNHHVTIAIGIT